MASATSLTASKISSLRGFGFRRSRFSLTSALSSALLCSGSGPFLFCRERSASRQNCRSLLPFIQFSFSGKTAGAAKQLPRRNGLNRKTHPTCAVQRDNEHTQRTSPRTPSGRPTDTRGDPSMQRQTDGATAPSPQTHTVPTALRPRKIPSGSSALEATLSQRTCQRAYRIARSGDPKSAYT